MIEQAFALGGLDWRFMTFEVEPPRLGDAMRGIRALGFHGVKIGEPFQESVVEHLDGVSDRARKCGSVNVITTEGDRLVGDNTEGAALVDLIRQQANIVGKRAMVVGAGRLARAIAVALADAGATGITVAARSAEKGAALVELLGKQTTASTTLVELSGPVIGVDPEAAVLVNASSLSTIDAMAKLPLDPATFGQKTLVADVAYNTSRTWLLRQAAERSCRTIDGLAIFVHQTALALEAWTRLKPDTVAMREAAEEFLGI